MKFSKKTSLISLAAVLLLVIIFIVWQKTASTTRIALFNFQSYQVANIALSNTDRFIKFEDVSVADIDKLKSYDFVLGFGMGLKLTTEERAKLHELGEKGLPIYMHAVTNPENHMEYVDSVKLESLIAYLENGNKVNYQNMARFIRRNIDGKKLFAKEAKPAIESLSDAFFHVDDKVAFESVSKYESYIKKKGIYRTNAPKVAIVAGIHDPLVEIKSI